MHQLYQLECFILQNFSHFFFFFQDNYNDGESTEEYKFFESQLDLFGKLCAVSFKFSLFCLKKLHLVWNLSSFGPVCVGTHPPPSLIIVR